MKYGVSHAAKALKEEDRKDMGEASQEPVPCEKPIRAKCNFTHKKFSCASCPGGTRQSGIGPHCRCQVVNVRFLSSEAPCFYPYAGLFLRGDWLHALLNYMRFQMAKVSTSIFLRFREKNHPCRQPHFRTGTALTFSPPRPCTKSQPAPCVPPAIFPTSIRRRIRHARQLACSPQGDPGAMRVGGASALLNSQYETQTTHTRRDHQEAVRSSDEKERREVFKKS
jgi:hypothetical protein